MKQFGLMAAVAAFSLTTAVQAADMPVYRKAPIAQVANWSGWYVGVNVGYAFNDPTVVFTPNDTATAQLPPAGSTFPTTSYDVKGVVGGAQIGYNWQVSPNWLIGLEADIQGSDIKGSGNSSFISFPAQPFTVNVQQNVEWFGTVRGRAGWVANDKLLVFATGGLAYGAVKESVNFASTNGAFGVVGLGGFGIGCATPGAPCLVADQTKVRTGYTVGGGLEYAFWQNVTFKLEYLYVNLGQTDATVRALSGFGGNAPGSLNAHFSDLDFNVVRAGLNYRF